ncbi:low molecular weight phosphatase family protein [Robertkochia marina]|uniref:protein-tyrosine-phosphatase n=1 Tax=Robertkochia marina TaxID=1227945 RepID=A0A4S3M520_9FLAO|nr:low molecular weight phosphatase family protein [Robertkochia marina]THD69431.1 low molecular weight phosphatase family protein [Robertkochia marina]TRZ47307.1 low molecular weight phosphatase family protein [Robertkochia marina]
MQQNILFICTGNYYRSRFAEIMFNHLTNHVDHGVTSFSRGLQLWSGNKGPLSKHTMTYMEQKGIDITEHLRLPLSLSLRDLKEATRVIAMDRKEHFVLMQEKYPEWAERIEYWSFEDDYIKDPALVLPALEKEVVKLVEAIKLPYFQPADK